MSQEELVYRYDKICSLVLVWIASNPCGLLPRRDCGPFPEQMCTEPSCLSFSDFFLSNTLKTVVNTASATQAGNLQLLSEPRLPGRLAKTFCKRPRQSLASMTQELLGIQQIHMHLVRHF